MFKTYGSNYSAGSKFPPNSYGKGVMANLLTSFFKKQRRIARLRNAKVMRNKKI